LSRHYDPSSPDYHHFLTVAEFTDQFGPGEEDFQAVVDYVETNGMKVSSRHANRMVVPISGTVEQAQRAFHVLMKAYRHPTENRDFFSADREPSLDLNVPVAHISGLNNYSLPRSMAIKGGTVRGIGSASVQGSGPDGSYISSDMRAAYYGGAALTGAGQTVELVQFDGYNIADVTAAFDGAATSSANGSNFVLAYTPTAGGVTYSIPVNNVLLDGTNSAPVFGDDAEQVLDIVQAIGMAPGLSQVRVYIGSLDVDILNAIASENAARQVSI
jgi:subtilase family serine protease